MKARPGSLDDEWLDGEANIPIEQELVEIDLFKMPTDEIAVLIGRAAAEIRALRLRVKTQDRCIDGLTNELEMAVTMFDEPAARRDAH